MKKYLDQFLIAYYMAILDIKIKYKRSYMGPWWNSITILFIACVVSFIWSKVLQVNFIDYLVKIFFSLSTWYYIISCLNDATEIFNKRYSRVLINSKIPIYNYILRSSLNSFIIYIHNLPLILIFLIFYNKLILSNLLFYFFGLFLFFLLSFFIYLFIGVICARFRDFGPLIKTITAPLMLITPVVWDKSDIGYYEKLVYLNPFTSFLEIISIPLLNQKIIFLPYIIVISTIIVSISLFFFIYDKFEKKIILWSL